ncbi:hypothetical protein [Pseudomonas sp. 24 E 1]|uniref:hypothetical protein n=1 Tax=unclassified Pseudomonas TaxID=196821 RepID=UPI000811D323|nr:MULTISPECIES: hypothetical protein [unclassified Pseudomonas]CRM02735.1 hypothetical protein [Pseudomonas sp. 24 E 1]CRM04427.1 hypothetical protein [Pseudomonas sp. 52 E 6]
MIGLIPNFYAVFSAITNLHSRTRDQASPHQATGLDQCPATRDLQSKPYTDPDLPAPYGKGYQYTATTNDKAWTGQTAATKDDYLDPEYALKAEEFSERNGKVYCDYGGKRLIKNGEVADPYLRLSTISDP